LRTLVLSDLHIGAGHGRSRLDAHALARLAPALATTDRLVLLGDIVELRERPLPDALAAASRVLPALVASLGAGREVIYLFGNHDHQLRLEPGALSELEAMLSASGASVRFEYPGVWLREDVYAHHGHYLDRHTTTPGFERLAAGLMARVVRLPAAEMSSAADYERVLAPIYAWMHTISQNGDGEVDAEEGGASMRLFKRIREAGRLEASVLGGGVRAVAAVLGWLGLGPLSGDLSDAQLTRAPLRAYGQVLTTLGLAPRYALFGHSHRAGPLPADSPAQWRTASGTALLNTGCWVNERFALTPASPYRPGFAVELDDAGPPRLRNLLDD
jgi:hypothetical protein